MGQRGPLKLPTHLRAVTDTKLAETAAEDVPREAPDKPKAILDDPLLEELWDSIVPELDRAGLISKVDGMAIVQMLRHYVISGEAMRVVSDESVVVKDAAIAGGMKKHPAEQVLRSESEMFLRYAQQLGMTFVARARTPSVKASDDGGEANPFAAKTLG